MLQHASNADEYLDLVNQYFSPTKIDESDLKTWEDFTDRLSNNLKETWARKLDAVERWNDLFRNFQNLTWAFRPRDMSYDVNDGFKAVLSLEIPNRSSRNVGLICHLSFIGDLIGIYYSDTDNLENVNPIVSSNGASRGQPERDTSYYPLNEFHQACKPKLLEVIRNVFPEFKEFDNGLADYKVASVQTEHGYYQNIDLFQVLFGTHINGVI